MTNIMATVGVLTPRLLLAGIAIAIMPGCRTFDPVDSFVAHLGRFETAYEKKFKAEYGEKLNNDYRLEWKLDCYSIEAKDDLVRPYRADGVGVFVRLPNDDGEYGMLDRYLAWEYNKGDRRWHLAHSEYTIHAGGIIGHSDIDPDRIAAAVEEHLTN